MAELELRIEGMSCQHCAMAVRKALLETPGVKDAQVEIGWAKVEYDEAQAGPQALRDAVRRAGYRVKE
jgi:copper chaperone